MASTLPISTLNREDSQKREISSRAITLTVVSVMLLACFLAGWVPIAFSIVTVFLFAGPHNWFEARYLLSRMPGHWGPLKPYFLTGICGVIGLTSLFAILPSLATLLDWNDSEWLTAIASWNSLLVAWIVALTLQRSHQKPRRDWNWIVPLAFTVVAINWLHPLAWSLSLVYLHPLMALWFLDRELQKRNSPWRRSYRCCLLLIPACLIALWFRLRGAVDLPADDILTSQIARHAGGDVLPLVSTRFLIAAHTFLEMLHYGIWIVAIPLFSVKAWPWQLSGIPLVRRSRVWQWSVGALIGTGFFIMFVLWGAFLSDYSTTRDVYFTVAMLHVLAEIPFLLRLI